MRQSSSEANGSHDLVVIGSGPAGQKAAIGAAKRGKRVALIELGFAADARDEGRTLETVS